MSKSVCLQHLNFLNYPLNLKTGGVATIAVALAAIATTAGFLAILAGAGVPITPFNSLGILSIPGGSILAGSGGVVFITGFAWIATKVIQSRFQHQPQKNPDYTSNPEKNPSTNNDSKIDNNSHPTIPDFPFLEELKRHFPEPRPIFNKEALLSLKKQIENHRNYFANLMQDSLIGLITGKIVIPKNGEEIPIQGKIDHPEQITMAINFITEQIKLYNEALDKTEKNIDKIELSDELIQEVEVLKNLEEIALVPILGKKEISDLNAIKCSPKFIKKQIENVMLRIASKKTIENDSVYLKRLFDNLSTELGLELPIPKSINTLTFEQFLQLFSPQDNDFETIKNLWEKINNLKKEDFNSFEQIDLFQNAANAFPHVNHSIWEKYPLVKESMLQQLNKSLTNEFISYQLDLTSKKDKALLNSVKQALTTLRNKGYEMPTLELIMNQENDDKVSQTLHSDELLSKARNISSIYQNYGTEQAAQALATMIKNLGTQQWDYTTKILQKTDLSDNVVNGIGTRALELSRQGN